MSARGRIAGNGLASESAMQEQRISSWGELQDLLYEDAWRADIARFRSPFAFRGVSDARHDLRSGLSRLGEQARTLEHHILRNFRRYAHAQSVKADSAWNWLAIAQHHGVPTRLLDWTYSPYVAMHFATEATEYFDRDGAIWSINYVKTNDLLPKSLRTILEEENAEAFTAEMLTLAADSLRGFDALAKKPFLVFFEPPSLDERIVNQFALFSLLSSPTVSLDEWLQRHPGVVRRLVIPASLKWEIRDKLDQANITERVLFPGLDGLGRWLARYYTPRSCVAPPDEQDSSGSSRTPSRRRMRRQ